MKIKAEICNEGCSKYKTKGFQPVLLHLFPYELMKMDKTVKWNSFFLQDVGKSILESYSRVMESLAFNIMARIVDLLYVDDATKARAAAEPMY